jgi:hypothetical protein
MTIADVKPLGQKGNFSGPVILHHDHVYAMFGGAIPPPSAADDFPNIPEPTLQALVEGKWTRCRWQMTSGLTSRNAFHGFSEWIIPEKAQELELSWQRLRRQPFSIADGLALGSTLQSADSGFVGPVTRWGNELFAMVVRSAGIGRPSAPPIEGRVGERWEECKPLARKTSTTGTFRYDFMHSEALPGATEFKVGEI